MNTYVKCARMSHRKSVVLFKDLVHLQNPFSVKEPQQLGRKELAKILVTRFVMSYRDKKGYTKCRPKYFALSKRNGGQYLLSLGSVVAMLRCA